MKHLYLEDGSVNPNLYSKDIIIYGCGNDGKKLFLSLKEIGIGTKFFCDSNESLVGNKLFDIPIISIRQLEKLDNYNLALAFSCWNEVADKIPENFKNNTFADYLFEKETDKPCILCKSKNSAYGKAHFAPFIRERMFLGNEKKTSLIHCRDCDLFFSEYRPNEEEITQQYFQYRGEKYQRQREKYEPNYTKSLNDSLFKESGNIVIRKKNLSNFLNPVIKMESIENLLDYGGDEGQFIPDEFINANKFVYEVSGNKVVDGVKLLKDIEEAKNVRWDFIMCCHLLEHLSYPFNEIESIVSLLSRDGFLYIEVPYEDRFKNYSDYEFNEHINFYSLQTLRKIGEICNLEIVKLQKQEENLRALYHKTT